MPSRRAAREKLPASKTALTARIRELVSDMTKPPGNRVIGSGAKATLLRIISDDYGVHANVITIHLVCLGRSAHAYR
jgi:hypothetical protein